MAACGCCLACLSMTWRRATLLGSDASSSAPAKETVETAGLQTSELLQLQQRTMSQQDEELAALEKTVPRTTASARLRAYAPACCR